MSQTLWNLPTYDRTVSVDESHLYTAEMTFIFGLKERIGSLGKSLKIFETNKVNLIHIESRPSQNEKGRYEFYVTCKAQTKEIIMSTVEELKKETIYLHILSVDAKHDEISGTGRDDWNERVTCLFRTKLICFQSRVVSEEN